jgi:hypothetical protein
MATSRAYVYIAVEGPTDEAVLRKVLSGFDVEVLECHGKRGQPHLKENLPRYNFAAAHRNWVVIADLNTKADCAPTLALEWLPRPSENMVFNVVVRKIEAWLLADRGNIANFLSVSRDKVPVYPESDLDPKMTLVNLARRSASRRIKEALVPAKGSTARVGPLYNVYLEEFIFRSWDFEYARSRAPSLDRLVEALGVWIA